MSDPGDQLHHPPDSTDPEQGGLFESIHDHWHFEPRARRTDPVTSHEAAESMVGAAKAQRKRVLLAMGSEKMTADAIDETLEVLGEWPRTTAGRRLPELLEMGLVERLEEKRKTRSGRRAHLWMAT